MRRLCLLTAVPLLLILSSPSVYSQGDGLWGTRRTDGLPHAAAAAEYLPTGLPAESSDPALEDRVLQLEAELAQLRNQPRRDPMTTLEQQLRQQDAGSGGLFGAIEVSFLKPRLSGIQGVYGVGPTTGFVATDYQVATRYILGYMSDSGVGVRARYWSFDQSSPYVPPHVPEQLGIHVQAADAEVVLAQRLRHWDLEVSGGLRYGQLEYVNPVATLFGVGNLMFDGTGPTVAVSGRRNLGTSGFALFGNLRGSLLFGDITNSGMLVNILPVRLENEIMRNVENQLGIAWTRQITRGAGLELRAAWESQYWMNNTISDDVYGLGTDLGFNGPTVAAELRY